MVTAFLAVLLLLFTVIKFFADSEFRTWAAWVGLIFAVVICIGAWMNMKMTGENFSDLQKLGGGSGGGGGGGSTSSSTPTDSAPPPSSGDDNPSS
jgi:hypothetical protein